MEDVLHFLKSGRKAPTSFEHLDKLTRRKRLHTLSEFSRNFEYVGMSNVIIIVIMLFYLKDIIPLSKTHG